MNYRFESRNTLARMLIRSYNRCVYRLASMVGHIVDKLRSPSLNRVVVGGAYVLGVAAAAMVLVGVMSLPELPYHSDVRAVIARSESEGLIYSGAIRGVSWSESLAEEAVEFIEANRGVAAYLPLMVLRRDYPTLYRSVSTAARIEVLCNALGHAQAMNDWGYLSPSDCLDEAAMLALVDMGAEVLPHLRPVLADKSPVMIYGSEASLLPRTYEYRRCDYAYRAYCLIKGIPHEFQETAALRDAVMAVALNVDSVPSYSEDKP